MKQRKLLLICPRQSYQSAYTVNDLRFPPLALAYLAALTPPHWQVELLDEMWEQATYRECDLVGITATTAQANRAYELAAMFRAKGKTVILGGMHATMVPDEARQRVDCIVMGEADNIWKRVLEDFEAGRLATTYKDDQEVDLSTLVRPRFELFDKRYKVAIVQTTRGCPMNCEFCSATAFSGFKYRKRPVSSVLDEIEAIPNQALFFADDNLLGHSKADEERFVELMTGMKERKIKKRWIAQVSMNFCGNDRAMRLAKEAGAAIVLIGFESIEQDVLGGTMRKQVNLKYIDARAGIQRAHAHGINICGTFIVGHDQDTAESFERLASYIEENEVDVPSINCLVPLPGTQLEKRLAAENRLVYRSLPQDWDMYNIGNRAMVDTKNMSRLEINRQVRNLYLRLFSYRAIWTRTLRVLLRNRSLVDMVLVLKSNLAYRGRNFGSAAFRDPEGAV